MIILEKNMNDDDIKLALIGLSCSDIKSLANDLALRYENQIINFNMLDVQSSACLL